MPEMCAHGQRYVAGCLYCDYRLGLQFSAAGDDAVTRPAHYKANGVESIDVIEAFDLGFHLGNVLKYVLRADRKHEDPIADLKKARWYLDREIARRSAA